MTTAPEVLFRLTATLNGLAAALQSGNPEAVLSAELPLSVAVQALTALDPSKCGALTGSRRQATGDSTSAGALADRLRRETQGVVPAAS